MRLTKHHGLGNDFLVTFDPVELTADLARALCDRRRGIGADGLIAARPGEGDVDVRMELRNSDGTVAAMSGNGIRCLAQAILDQRGVAAAELLIGTAAGVRHVTIELSGGRGEAWARADMGAVGPGPLPLGPLAACLADSMGFQPRMDTADIGNPHLVIEVEDPWQVDLARLGPELEVSYAGGINVEFIRATPGRSDEIDLTVWERGAGITLACGTGASAASSVAVGWGLARSPVTVHLPGGDVVVEVGSTVWLSGPTVLVASLETAAFHA